MASNRLFVQLFCIKPKSERFSVKYNRLNVVENVKSKTEMALFS